MDRDKKDVNYSVVEFWTAIFILLVLFVHHDDYAIYYLRFIENYFPLQDFIAYFAVGSFIFLSGYKLVKSKLNNSFIEFWKNRLVRIYPLYFLALIFFSIFVIKSLNLGNFIIHSLALQSILPDLVVEKYPTLWFVALIFMFYLIFSLIKKQLKRPSYFLLISSLIFVAFYLIHLASHKMGFEVFSYSFFFYYFIFIAGMFFSYYKSKIQNSFYFNKLIGLFSFVPLFLISYLLKNMSELLSLLFINLALIPLYLIVMSIKLKDWFLNKKIIKNIAYASFCMFLFHRPVWQVMEDLWSQKSFAQWVYIVFFGFMIIYIVSYGMQYGYDRLVRKFRQSNVQTG